MFAEVLPDISDVASASLYTYIIPPALADQVKVGSRVAVPWHKRQLNGFVFAISANTNLPAEKLRPLLAVKSNEPAFTGEQAQLARLLADYYLCPLTEALKPCLAEAGGQQGKRRWQVVDIPAGQILLPEPVQLAVLDHIRHHPGVSGSQLRSLFGEACWTALDNLRRDGYIRPLHEKGLRSKTVRILLPALPANELRTIADDLRAQKQAQLLRWAANHLHQLDHAEFRSFGNNEAAHEAEVSPAVVKACIDKGWLLNEKLAIRRNPWDQVEGRKATPPTLSDTQEDAVTVIRAAINSRQAKSFLLYGVTGSGKTEVFLHAIETVISQGRQAIILVPEISLTAQAMALYHGRFPGQVAVLHSHLSAGERYDEWQRIAHGEAMVILGARSAIFAPCPALGLIIIDEEHESSYKQESPPRYHAKTVALMRSRLCSAPLVMASATPSLESMREAELGIHQLLRLPERISARPMPPVKLINLASMTSGARILSAPLREAIGKRLTDKQQVILFLNRRGYSYSLLCRSCGHFASCPHCSVALTYHLQAKMLRCHHCDYQLRPPAACPQCHGEQIAFKGVGTERLQDEVATCWPQARIARLDRDSTTRKGAHHEILGHFEREETDILIGTQMVTKGFDFPKVTLVGVIAADTSLAVSDFRAAERTFQLLTQVAGRAGRAEWQGEVLVQSWQPDHYAIQAAAAHDYQSFYQQEITYRGESLACWPPLTCLINILINGENEDEVRTTAQALSRRAREAGATRAQLPALPEMEMLPGMLELLRDDEDITALTDTDNDELLLQRPLLEGVVVNDATPCLFPRLRGRFRYHLLLRCRQRAQLLQIAKELQQITPPKGIVVVIDIDPMTLA